MLERALDPSRLSAIESASSLHVLAVGKAAPYMAAALAPRCPRLPTEALVVGAQCPIPLPKGHTWIAAGHPVPDSNSVEAGRQALALASRVPSDGLLLVLLSGGASALLALPTPPLTLEHKQQTTNRLLRAGADIHALNTVRKHLSAVKGGRLAARCGGRILALVVSDVIGDDLSVIGSGPTVADDTSFHDAWEVVRRFGGTEAFPETVVRHLLDGCRGLSEETPKPGDPRLARVATSVIGSRTTAMEGAREAAERLEYEVEVATAPVVGEAREAGADLATRARKWVGGRHRPRCLISSGETTVTVSGRGRGGRNQELALGVALALGGVGPFALLSAGTDGIDGPTDAAGAIVDHTTLERVGLRGRDEAAEALGDNNSYAFFERLGDLIVTGPTDTNVGDLQVCLTGPAGAEDNEQ